MAAFRDESRPVVLAGASVDSLYRLYADDIRKYVARAFGPGPPEPDDVAQAAFEKIASSDSLENVRNPRAFLYRIAHNIAITHYRRAQSHSNYVEHEMAQGKERFTDDLHPERVLLARERMSCLEQAYRLLPDLQQDLLVLHRIHGLSYAEIARQKLMSQTEVKRQVALAVLACEAHIERALSKPGIRAKEQA